MQMKSKGNAEKLRCSIYAEAHYREINLNQIDEKKELRISTYFWIKDYIVVKMRVMIVIYTCIYSHKSFFIKARFKNYHSLIKYEIKIDSFETYYDSTTDIKLLWCK